MRTYMLFVEFDSFLLIHFEFHSFFPVGPVLHMSLRPNQVFSSTETLKGFI